MRFARVNLMRGVVRLALGEVGSPSSFVSRAWRVERRVPRDCLDGVVGRLGEADRRRVRVLDRVSWVAAFRGGGLEDALEGIGLPEEMGRLEGAGAEVGVELWAGLLLWPLADAYLFLGGLGCWP